MSTNAATLPALDASAGPPGTAPPRISVVVPFRNAERTLRRCLDSLLSQADADFEVIAVDDASEDRSAEIGRELSSVERRLRIVARAERGGAQRARRDGIAVATGEIVAFTDADCEAPPLWLARLRKGLTPDRVAVGGQYRIPEGLPVVARFETHSLLDYWYRHMPPSTDHVATGCAAVWRRHLTPEVLEAGVAFADLTSGDDTAMSLALARMGELHYDEGLYVLHHTRTSLRAYLSQQLRRGQSRSRLSLRHFDAKVLRARDTRMGLIAAHIVSAWAGLGAAVTLAALGHPLPAAAALLPFLALQLPLLARTVRAGEGPGFLAASLGLALARNLAWGVGGLRGAVRALGRRGA